MTAKIEFDEAKWKELNALLQFKVTLRFCADYLGVSRDTIIRRIKEDFGMTFGEYHELRMENTATKLQQKAIEMALKGDRTMLIFALKNLARWADKVEETVKQELKITPAFEIVEYDESESDQDQAI